MPTELDSFETLEKYSHRVPPIDANNPTIELYSAEDAVKVFFHWQQRQSDYSSEIVISFSDSVSADLQAISEWKNRPRIIISSFQVGEDKHTKLRNPFDSIRIMLTLISTITELSERFGTFTHIVRANKHSQPLFELLTSMGVYYLSDEVGERVDKPKIWSSDLGSFTLYACKYPVTGLPELSAYAPKEFVDALSKGYSEHALKLSDPIT